MSTPDPRAAALETVDTELTRVIRRWQQLPLDHALSVAPEVQDLIQSLADRVAAAQSMPSCPVPDLGPAVLMDQLRVMVYDYDVAGLDPVPLAEELSALRRRVG